MGRIGSVGGVAPAQPLAGRAAPGRTTRARQPQGGASQGASQAASTGTRALAVIGGGVIGGGLRDAGPGADARGVRPRAAFVAQLLVAADPGLTPSRPERTRSAAALYAAAARRLA